jgi:hypothetical protein
MSSSVRRAIGGFMTAALVAGCIVAPALAAAKKNHTVTWHEAGAVTGITLKGTVSGAFTGTYSGKLVIPDTQQTIKTKNGTIKFTGVGTTGAANDAAGTWKVTAGTGRYKGATGKGTFTGKQSTGKFTYKGTIKF